MLPPSFRHRSGLLALTAAMLITACGAGDDQAITEQGRDPYAVARDLIALDQDTVSDTGSGTASGAASDAVPADQIPAAIASTDCIRTVVVDEYGFEDETITCPDDETSGADQPPTTAAAAGPSVAELDQLDGFLPIDLYDAVIGLVPDPTLSARFQEIGRYLALVEAACGVDQDRWYEAVTAYTAAAEPLSATLAEQVGQDGETNLDGFIGSLEAKVVARAVVERAVMGSGCANPDAEPLPRSAVDEASLALTAAATAATVAIDNTLRASTYGPLFHLYSTLPNYQWMRSEVSAIDMVLLGTSQLGAGVDVAALNAGLTTEVGSAWIPGALAEVQQHWVDDVVAYTDAATLVWFIGPLDLFVECDVTVRGAEFQQLADARAAAFRAGGFVAQASPIERILGPAERTVTVRGDAEKRPGPDVDGLAAHRDQYGPAFAEGWFCDQRAAIVADTIGRLENQGRNVLVVGMPVHPELRSIRPADRPPLGEVLAPYLSPDSFIDLSDRMDDAALWSDMTHLTAEGATIYTDLVTAELAGRGY